MLAVNAWDEPKGDVQRFMKDNKLSHPVLLNGSAVGGKMYGIAGVPANFWIDKEGTVVRQTVGFKQGKQKKMDEWIKDML